MTRQQLRECLYARAAAQDHLRSSADEIAADMFEAEEGLMGFEQGPGGGQDTDDASPISCPPPADVWSAGSEGVARARAAASEALAKSLRLARERVEQLEALTAEVRSGKGRKRAVVSYRAGAGARTRVAPVPGEEKEEELKAARPGGEAVVAEGVRLPREEKDDGVGEAGADDGAAGGAVAAAAAAAAVGTGGSSSDSSWSFPSSGQDGNDGGQAGDPEKPVAAGDGVSARENPDLGAAAAAADPPSSSAGENGEQVDDALARKNSTAARAGSTGGDAGVLAGADETRRSVFENGGGGGGSGDGIRPAGAAPASEEAERWKMAARRSEASLADLRETLVGVLALSFRCGQESARRREGEWEGEEEGERRPRGDCDEASRGGPGDVVGVVAPKEGHVDGGGAAERSGVSELAVAGDGGGGSCCGRGRCSSCEAKAAAVEVLLRR